VLRLPARSTARTPKWKLSFVMFSTVYEIWRDTTEPFWTHSSFVGAVTS
jgi:hypothetical protein